MDKGPNLKQIIIALENIEKQNLSKDPEIIEWINQITDPDFDLVFSLIDLFIDNKGNSQTQNLILKVLRKFNIYKRENVLPQMIKSKKFPQAISDYITQQNLELISQEIYFILAEIFQYENFHPCIDEAFMVGLFNGLGIVQDQENFYSIIKIITNINSEYSVGSQKSQSENIFLKTFYYHDKAGVLIEGMIRILNIDPDKDVKCVVLQSFIDLMESSPICVIYSCDLESFIDVSLKILETTYTQKLRLCLLKALSLLTKFEEYYKLKYKYLELIEIIESYLEHQDVNEKCKELCRKILENIKASCF